MNEFEIFSYNEICAALASISTEIKPAIYAISFFVFDIDDDPRFPVLQLGYNTRAHVAACTPSASDAVEATWNFAFWLQNELKFIGEPGTEGGRMLEALLKEKGLWYSDEEDDDDFDRCTEIGRQITACFVETCVRISQALHANGIVAQQFSAPIPILVHELEYYDEIAAQTRAANPPGLTKEFEGWIARMNSDAPFQL